MNTWDMRRTIGAIGVAVAIAGVGGAAIAAATDGGHSMMDGGMRGFGGPPPAGDSAHHPDAAPGSLHGQYVVGDGHGGFTTVLSQTGRVTAISATSVTARSDDGFVQTYAIGKTVAKPLAAGDEVVIDGTKNGETAELTSMRPPPSSSQLGG